jgi:hypothetical protein
VPEFEGTLIMDALTFYGGQDGEQKMNPTRSLYGVTSAAGVLAWTADADYNIRGFWAAVGSLISRNNGSYVNQTTGAGFHPDIICEAQISSPVSYIFVPIKSGEVIYIVHSSGTRSLTVLESVVA